MANYKDNNGGRVRRKKRNRTHGFLTRSRKSKEILKRRRTRGRKTLAPSARRNRFSKLSGRSKFAQGK